MMQRTFFSAFAAILLSASLVGTVEAYPTTATSARTTVTGTYRPLDLNLTTLVDGTDALNYTVGGGPFSFQVDVSGTFTGVGYPGPAPTGVAGTWRLLLSDSYPGITSNDDGNLIYLFSAGDGLQHKVGTLTYLGGGDIAGLPFADRPQVGDFFELFTTRVETFTTTVLQVSCDNILTCNAFDLTLIQDLAHIGPYNVLGATGQIGLDGSRLNMDCGPANDPHPCGLIPGLPVRPDLISLTASAVPEPATLALLGLGLAGLGLSRRARS